LNDGIDNGSWSSAPGPLPPNVPDENVSASVVNAVDVKSSILGDLDRKRLPERLAA